MNYSDRPVLGLDFEYALEKSSQQFETILWQELRTMQVLTPVGQEAFKKSPFANYPAFRFQPPTPRSPVALRRILTVHPSMLFDSQANFYPNDPRLKHWLIKLAERISAKTMGIIAEVEKAGRETMMSLDHHGLTQAQMRSAVNAALEERIKACLIKSAGDEIKASLAKARTPSDSTAAAEQVKVKPKRLSATVYRPNAARKMEDYITQNGVDQTKFAIKVGTTDRTLRNFRKTGKIRRNIFEDIAKAMGTTKEALLKD
jgi:hypothetical protein